MLFTLFKHKFYVQLTFKHIQSDIDTYSDLGRVGHKDPLEHFGDVSQVEGVVALCRCWQELSADEAVDFDTRVH